MKALVRKSLNAGDFAYEEVPKPQHKEDEALIKIKAVGVCGTDVHIYTGHVVTDTPMIIGHELCGVVEEIGSDVNNVKVGDRVVSRLNVGVCGSCRACLTGSPHMCQHRQCPGYKIPGADAEYMAIEAKQLIRLSDQIEFVHGAIVEPMAIVAHALLERSKVEPEDIVVIFGPGPIGLIALQMARLNGAAKIIVVGTDIDLPKRLRLAGKLGADLLLNAQRENIEEIVADLTGGKGVDLVIEASGAESAINTGIRILRRQGRMCVLGLPTENRSNVGWLDAAEKSLSIVFNYSSSPWSWNMAVSMLDRGAFHAEDLITHIYPLEKYTEMFDAIKNGEVIKGVFLP